MKRIDGIHQLYDALALVHETIPWVPDFPQDKLAKAEQLMRDGLKQLETYLDALKSTPQETVTTDNHDNWDVCYTCQHMCNIRKKYIGATILHCVKYKKSKRMVNDEEED